MSQTRFVDNLILGGGVAGSMLGFRLASAGRQVTLLEREFGPHHKVCGEFLSREAVAYLHQAGVDPLAMGAETIRALRLATRNSVIESRLPFTAHSLSRRLLDEVMLARAAEQGCTVICGVSVGAINRDGQNWQIHLRNGDLWRADTAFLASGKHDLKGLARVENGKPTPHAAMVGFKLHWRLAQAQIEALRGHMDLVLFHGGYGGLSLIEGDVANFCLVVRQTVLRAHGQWPALLAAIQRENPHLAHRLQHATPLWDRPMAISSIPYGYLAGRPGGLWSIGDQAAVIPSFTGDGMSIAMHSANLAAEMYLAGKTSDEYHECLHAHLHRGMTVATAISRALVSDLGRAFAPIGLRAFPAAINWIAGATRIPDVAMQRTGTV